MKLYVGNLPWAIDDSALKDLFSSYGAEEANTIRDKFSGRSKGFGFVTIPDDESAKKAIKEMNQKDVQGRPLTVSEARPMTNRDERKESNDAPEANSEDVNESTEDSIEEETEDSLKEDKE